MTKRQDVGSSWFSKIRRGGSAVAAIGLLGSLAVAASGCDTVALISFSERSFTNIHSSGFTPAADSCEGVGGDGKMAVRFVVTDNNGRPIQLGDPVENQNVELSNDSVELNDSALMEVSEGGACASNDDCQTSGFTCDKAPGLDPNNSAGVNLDRCLAPEGINVLSAPDAVDFIADNQENQVFGMLMENSGSLVGWNPADTNGYWDFNGDGDTEDAEDLGRPENLGRLGPPIATDEGFQRAGAVLKSYSPWIAAYKVAFEKGRKTYFGLWSFDASSVEPTSHVAEKSSADNYWTDDKFIVEGAIGDYRVTADSPKQNGANVYESAVQVINNAYTKEALSDRGILRPGSVDKVLVIFVDGYDDMRDQIDSNIDEVVQAATDNNVRVFVVHLDPKLEDPAQLREDPMYPQGQTSCSDGSTCKNYESCRRPKLYSDSPGPVALPEGADYDATQTYCMPERDEFGRVGPIHDYARLACETQGGYIYVPSAELLATQMSWLPYALDGLWEAKVSSQKMQRGQAPEGQAVKIHSNMSVTVAGQNRSYPFTQLGNLSGAGADTTADDFDTRGVVFTAE